MTIQEQNHLSIVERFPREDRGFHLNANSHPDSSKVLMSDIIVDHCPQLEFYFFILETKAGNHETKLTRHISPIVPLTLTQAPGSNPAGSEVKSP